VALTKKKLLAATAAAATALALTAACSSSKSNEPGGGPAGASGYNAATKGVVNPGGAKGGTLKLISAQDADSWDPARGYYAFVWDMNRFYTRTLLGYPSAQGADGLKLVPDLAQALPEISADGKTYTFKLKAGVKFEDGSAITSKDVKYGIERIFAQDILPGGPVYLIDKLDQGQKYPGPYKDTDPAKMGLKSIETPDDQTIVFHLASAFADFQYLLAMPGAGPVPPAKDTGAQYGQKPVSSGPYMFESYDPGKKVVLVRNPNWDASTDTIRKALPDRVELTISTNADEIDNQLIDGTMDLDVGQTGVQSAAQVKILQDPNLKKNADNPVTGFIRYAAMATIVKPFDNVHCRKAVIYAADHTALQTTRGGPIAGGDIGTNMLPPNILGSDPSYDPYNVTQGAPQIDKAKQELAACGQPNGFKTTIAVRNNRPKEVKGAESLQQALKAVGIDAAIFQYDGAQISTVIGSPDNVRKNGYGIQVAGWGADWQSGTGYLQPLIDGRFLLPVGNFNLPCVNDPVINGLFDKAAAEPDPVKAAEFYKQINQNMTENAYYLPFTFDKALNYRNPRLHNVYVHDAFGMVDFQALAVQ
jgi:peptide/nickel transport system substrate-binding protein